MEMKPSEVLERAYALLCEPGKRVKGVYASEAPPAPNGQPRGNLHLYGNDPRAVCFCSIGVVQHVLGSDDGVHRAYDFLSGGANAVAPDFGIPWVNDHGTDEQFHAMWKGAIQLAKEAGQ